MTPDECPNCGAAVPRRAKACPECGADESTGWNDRAVEDRLGIVGDEFDYESYSKEEFGKPKPRRLHWLWVLVAIGLLWAMLRWYWPSH